MRALADRRTGTGTVLGGCPAAHWGLSGWPGHVGVSGPLQGFRSLYRERIKHVDRYRVNTSRGEPGISTNSLTEAGKWAARWQTEVEEVED